MMDLVGLLNENYGAVMCLLTLVYVVATWKIVSTNQETIKEMQETREVEFRPYVFINLETYPLDNYFYLRIKNYGKTGAKFEKISISPRIILAQEAFHGKKAELDEILNGVTLAPFQVIELMVIDYNAETKTYNENIRKSDYTITLQYTSITGNKKQYNDTYTLPVKYANQQGFVTNTSDKFSDEANALNAIAKHLDAIKRK